MFSRDRSYPGDSGEPLHQNLITLSILFPTVLTIAAQATTPPSTTAHHKSMYTPELGVYGTCTVAITVGLRKKKKKQPPALQPLFPLLKKKSIFFFF